MRRTIDEHMLGGMQTLDKNNPPTKEIGMIEYPKMIYKHPKDKAKEHKTKIVTSKQELDAALKEGWTTKPHIPVVPAPADDDE